MVSLSICSTFLIVSSPAFSSMPVKRKFARREYCCWSSIDTSSSSTFFSSLVILCSLFSSCVVRLVTRTVSESILSCNLSESVCNARITRSSFSASMRWSTRESSMAMPLLCSRISVIGSLDSRLPLSLFRLFCLFG